MTLVEMQTAVLPPSFPVSDTRPSQSNPYLDHIQRPTKYADSRTSSKENKSPPVPENVEKQVFSSPLSAHGPDTELQDPLSTHTSPRSAVAGKKRSANGDFKEPTTKPLDEAGLTKTGHSRTASSLSNTSTASMHELSQQLRTRLAYAMVKVQNGWHHRSLEEVESLASASPRSTTFNHYSQNRHLLSPRTAMVAHISRDSSDTSSEPRRSQSPPPHTIPTISSPPPGKKSLAPPANIVSRPSQERRRPTLNNGYAPGQPLSTRPNMTYRTPSQSAAMEADAVETLLFMASPNNSGTGKNSSQFSPITSAPSVYNFSPSQTSPLRNTFTASPRSVARGLTNGYTAPYGRDKNEIIASLVERLDDEGDADLDEALKLLDRHHATKLTT
ncbi:hypothetical protein LTR05_004185 [Lithohypha guttulata]|uniref:Uncharacterized protein n=1 Tax=Lithohypha guttulata TaxID=1690604 RepID=A0AAN7YI65_9EURO|nr:hypothetical protein LTR05_004185 [Lithohypha guttulata]